MVESDPGRKWTCPHLGLIIVSINIIWLKVALTGNRQAPTGRGQIRIEGYNCINKYLMVESDPDRKWTGSHRKGTCPYRGLINVSINTLWWNVMLTESGQAPTGRGHVRI